MDVDRDVKTGQPLPVEEGTTTARPRKHHHLHTATTRHPLILIIRGGTIDLDLLQRWLVSAGISVTPVTCGSLL
ncbi:hypothetical protein MLD38_020571 [Melastoma candidum]|uniref:Uncharacterized protein n=1 Tax=Melastoma candidum TaxID=119954 RepID=A0ACB9QDL7_9MYRT|nr:hypothetical protein MLD38_020571 [Melastoma candidum]